MSLQLLWNTLLEISRKLHRDGLSERIFATTFRFIYDPRDVSKTINPKPIPAFCELNNNNVSDLDKVIYLEKNQPKFYSKGNYKVKKHFHQILHDTCSFDVPVKGHVALTASV